MNSTPAASMSTLLPDAEVIALCERRFAKSNRCLVIASGFYEFTGTSHPKTKHRFALNDTPCMAIVGIRRPATGNG